MALVEPFPLPDPIPPPAGGDVFRVPFPRQPVTVPPGIPGKGPDVPYNVYDHTPTWADTWDWVKSTAGGLYNFLSGGSGVSADQVVKIVESYSGQLLKGLSSAINDVADFAANGIGAAQQTIDDSFGLALDFMLGMEDQIAGLQTWATNLANIGIPALFGEIIRLGASIGPRVLAGEAAVETWAVDNIFKPLYDAIGQAEHQASQALDARTWQILDTLHHDILNQLAPVLGEVGALKLAVKALATEAEQCTTPMCDVMGPKTDLGKFLKALSLVANAALLVELANLDRNGIESLLRGLASLSHGIIDDIDTIFTGGATLGGAITRAGG